MPAKNDIFFRRGASSNWSSVNPVLNSGEPGFDVTLKKLKIGDGVTPWNDLEWVGVINVSGEVIFPEALYDVSGIFFDTSFGAVDQVEGQLNWNNETGTIDVGLSPDLTMHIGQDIFFRVKNSTGSPITKGEAVAATGVIGGGEVVQIAPFAVDGSIDEVRFIGLVADDISNGGDGYVVNFGHVKNVDLRTSNSTLNPNGETWNVGDILFVDDSSAGGLTKVQPKDDIYVAMVLDDGQNGELLVRITDPGHISDLHDVNTSGVTNQQYLTYQSSTDTWIPTSSGIFTSGIIDQAIIGDIEIIDNTISSLSGDLLLYPECSGYVGINVDEPNSMLHVYSSVSGDNLFNVEGTYGSLFFVDDNLSGSIFSVNNIAGFPIFEVFSDDSVVAGRYGENDFVISSGGNVGMGTSTPTTKLDVSGVITATGGNSNEWNEAYDWINASGVDGSGAANHIAYWSDSNSITYDASQLYWDSSNNRLGIGTSSPARDLDIVNAGNSVLRIASTSSNEDASIILENAAQGWTIQNDGNASLGTANYFHIADITANSSRLVIDTNGNLGIGTTSPSRILHAKYGSTSNPNVALIESSDSTNNKSFLRFTDPSTSSITNEPHIGSAGDNLVIYTSNLERLRIAAGGNVGIGTTSPSEKLHVMGGTRIQGDSTNTTWTNPSPVFAIKRSNDHPFISYHNNAGNRVGYLQFSSSQDANLNVDSNYGLRVRTNNTDHFYFSNDGKLAITSTYPFTPQQKLHIDNGNVRVENTTPVIEFHDTSAVGADISFVNDGLVLSHADVTGDNQLVIASNSGVGVGTNAPTATLHAYSPVPSSTVFNVEGTNGSLFSVVDNLSGVLMSVNNNAGLPVFEVYDDDSIIAGRFAQNDFVVSSGGDIGIGTASPSSKLHVYSAGQNPGMILESDSTAGAWIKTKSNQTGAEEFKFGTNNTGWHVHNDTDGAYRLSIVNGGNVGIGTSSPASKLHVADGLLRISHSSASPALELKRDGYNNWEFFVSNINLYIEPKDVEGDLYFRDVNGTTSLQIDNSANNVYVPNGNVGINNTSPAYTLDVAGTANITGDVIVGGNVTVNGTTVSANVDTMEVADPILTLGLSSGNIVTNTNLDRGMALALNDGVMGFMGWDTSENEFSLLSSGVASNGSGNYAPGTYGDLHVGNLEATDGYFSGNVGIATSSPSYPLHVVAGSSYAYFSSNAVSAIKSVRGSSQNAGIDIGNTVGTWTIGKATDGFFGFSHNNQNINGSALFAITTAGNVGIGDTTPSYKLDVNGTAGFSSTINAPNIGAGEDDSVVILDSDGKLRTDEIDSRVWGSTLADADDIAYVSGLAVGASGVNGTGSSGQVAFWTGTNDIAGDSSLFWDNTNDRLGINTASPQYELHVKASSYAAGAAIESSSNQSSTLYFIQESVAGTGYIAHSTWSNGMIFKTGRDWVDGGFRWRNNANSQLMRLTTDGNLGININEPSGTLHVVGEAYVDNLKLDGNTLSATDTNGDLILSANGNGAIQRDTGGNNRGIYAIDFQNRRVANTQVASSNYSVITGGYSNTSSNYYSTISGGYCNTASGNSSIVAGGRSNIACASSSSVLGGSSNCATNSYATVGGGNTNWATGCGTFIGGGYSNCASNSYATSVAGYNNTASGNGSFVGGGYSNTASLNDSTVVGGNNNSASKRAFVGGGCCNSASGFYSTVSGGRSNTAIGACSTVSGGYANIATGSQTTIGGGFSNRAFCLRSTVSGGYKNEAVGSYSTISGGDCNHAENTATASFIGGGKQNCTACVYSAVVGGLLNVASGDYSAVVAGSGNIASGACSFIGAGNNNTNCGPGSNLTAGINNIITGGGAYAVIAGGNSNCVTSYVGTVGGGRLNCVFANDATIAGGSTNTIQASGTWGFIGGGCSNLICGDGSCYAVIAGGFDNTASNCYATIGGGRLNVASGCCSTIGGGRSNTASECNSTVGGGRMNTAGEWYATVGGGWNNCATQQCSTIGGGYLNTSSSTATTVAGGHGNTASGGRSFVGGGRTNVASGACSTVSGGYNNCATSTYSTVGGGNCNAASGLCSTVSGGYCNVATGDRSTIAGGRCNCSAGHYAALIGGVRNSASGDYSTVGGGFCNLASSSRSTVSGGYGNISCAFYAIVGGGFCNTASGRYSTVSGGCSNNASEYSATIAGGWNNTASATCSTVGGGRQNIACGQDSTVSGGYNNLAGSTRSTVGGGWCNCASGGAGYNTVSGGRSNNASTTYAFIGGGNDNTASGYTSTVAGGRNNQAIGIYSTVGGGDYNYSCGQYAFVGGGRDNVNKGNYSTIAGGWTNNICLNANRSAILGGNNNTISGAYSSISAGQCNNDGGYANVHILGSGITATQADTTYTQNIIADGHLAATTKSFLINHPTRPGHKLQYGSLESPYHGVRLTGRDKITSGWCVVKLPEYIRELVNDDEDVNIQLTNYRHGKTLYVSEVNVAHNEFTVKTDSWFGNDLEFFWSFTATRKDIDPLRVEY